MRFLRGGEACILNARYSMQMYILVRHHDDGVFQRKHTRHDATLCNGAVQFVLRYVKYFKQFPQKFCALFLNPFGVFVCVCTEIILCSLYYVV